MFGKPASPVGPSAGEVTRRPLPASFLAENLVLTGALASDGEAHLDGTLRGDVRVKQLVIGPTGGVEGAVEAEVVEVRGRVRGPITAHAVRLHASADVEGDITHAELTIEAGARFVGRSMRAEPAPPLSVVTAAE